MHALRFHEQVQQRLAELQDAVSDPDVGPLLTQLRQLDGEAVVRELERELLRSFELYRGLTAGKGPLSALKFYWAGADISPYIPTEAWGSGYSGHDFDGSALRPHGALFHDRGGFPVEPLPLLHDAAEDGPLSDHARFDALRELFRLQSFEWAALALERAVASEAFRALPITRPFPIFGQGGHDEDTVVLHVVTD